MAIKRRSFNLKREMAPDPRPEDLKRWSESARYGGNPEHKRNPGNFGLTPPAAHTGDSALCDEAGIFDQRTATKLLQEGFRRGLVSSRVRGDGAFPQNVWAVSAEGIPLEAQLENQATGTYHGYPMPKEDPFRDKVLERWQAHGK